MRRRSVSFVRALLGFLLALAALSPAHAQPTLEVGFARDVNRYRWTAEAVWTETTGPWRFDLTNRFTSDAFLLSRGGLNLRDEDRLSWSVGRVFSPRLTGEVRGRGAWFSQGRVATQEGLAVLRIALRPYAWVAPALGVAWDRRPGIAAEGTPPLRSDAGPQVGVAFAWAPPPIDGYRIQARGDADWQWITPRRGRAVRLDSRLARAFEATDLSADLRLASVRRDAYQAVSFLNRDATSTPRGIESIEATTSDTARATVAVTTPLGGGFQLESLLGLGATNRTIRTLRAPTDALFFDTDFRRRTLDLDVALAYERPRLTSRVAVQYGAEVERRTLANREELPPAQAAQNSDLLRQADYDEGALALVARLQATPWPRLTITADGRASILRHDTPEINADDRDEVFHTARLGLQWQLSEVLAVTTQLFGSTYHTVYLNAARSAENSVQRSLRLRPGLRWQPTERTDVRFTTEVRATYTVDDFVLTGRRPTDQAARELRYTVDLEHLVAPQLRLLIDASRSDLQLGRLLWDQFAEIPFDTLRTTSGWVRLRSEGRVTAEVGVRAFIRSDFDRAATATYTPIDETGAVVVDDQGRPIVQRISRPGRTWIEQIGPTAALTWSLGLDGSALRLDGWLTRQRIHRRLYGTLPEVNAARIRAAARRGERRLIPNLALTATWVF